MTTTEDALSSDEDFQAELQALLLRAYTADIDLEGGWDCRNGDGHPDWDVIVTEVRKPDEQE
ncbi:hypothetical protein [Natronosalvus vescus]|uniref:hypothetical protein n=1 Tax=Natronosalvus vescus TaxID=2953881 RepID=UPI002090210C|nr:hypothetical protein [Natronosalvus vescus]